MVVQQITLSSNDYDQSYYLQMKPQKHHFQTRSGQGHNRHVNPSRPASTYSNRHPAIHMNQIDEKVKMENQSPQNNSHAALDVVQLERDPQKRSVMIANYKLANTYRFPADLGVALCHKEANRLGRKDIEHYIRSAEKGSVHPISQSNEVKENFRVCPCCENTMIVEEFPLCISTDLFKVERGAFKNELPLKIIVYLTFIKMVIVYLLVRFVIFDIATIIMSLKNNYCESVTDTSDPCIISYSGYNLNSQSDQDRLYILDILNSVFVIIALALFVLFRKILNKQKNLFVPFPFFKDSNYTILLEKLPPFFFREKTPKEHTDYHYEYMIEKVVEDKIGEYLRFLWEHRHSQELSKEDRYCLEQVVQGSGKSIEQLKNEAVAAVTICYDLPELANITRMRKQLLKQFSKDSDSSYEDDTKEEDKERLQYIPNQVKHLNQNYVRLCTHFQEDEDRVTEIKLTHFTGRAFVSFEYQHYKNYMLKGYQLDESFLQISGKNIKIDYSNEPQDVNWENMIVSDVQRNKRILYTWVTLLLVLILSFAAFFLLEIWQQIQKRNEDSGDTSQQVVDTNPEVYGFTVSSLQSLLSYGINKVLNYAMKKLSTMQRHKIQSDRLKSLAVKVIIAQTINVVVIYGILYLIYLDNVMGSYGLVYKLLTYMAIHCLLHFLRALFHTKYLRKWWKLRYYTKKQLKKPIKQFQLKLNKKLQLPTFNFPKAYAFYIIAVYVVCFYGYINPFLSLVPIPLFFLQYWVDKYNIFRRFSCPEGFDLEFTEKMLSFLEFSLVMSSFGFFVWDTGIHYSSNGGLVFLNIIAFVVPAVYVFVFTYYHEATRNKLLRNHKKPDVLSYSDYMSFKINKFAKTFYTENPATAMFRDLGLVYNYISDSTLIKEKEKAMDKYIPERTFKKYQPKYRKHTEQKINVDTFMDDQLHAQHQKKGPLRNKLKLKSLWRQREEDISKSGYKMEQGQRGYLYDAYDLLYDEAGQLRVDQKDPKRKPVRKSPQD